MVYTYTRRRKEPKMSRKGEKRKREKMEKDTEKENKKRLLNLRTRLKKRKPDFVRQESWRYKRVKSSWRRPKGKDSKMRLEIGGWPKSVKIGYRSPRKIRGFHPSGLKELIVHRPEELDSVNPAEFAVRIAHGVGSRKRIKILDKAEELDIKVLNPGGVKELEESEETSI